MNIPCRTLLMGFPKRRFSPQELARAIPDPPSPALRAAAWLNAVFMVAVATMGAPATARWPSAFMMALVALLTLAGLKRAWADPGDRWVRRVYYALPLVAGLLLGLGLRLDWASQRLASLAGLAVMVACIALWMAVVYRHQHVVLRLAELDERDRAVALARQLANAQVQPHFLFNSLASLQHWVQTQDARAAPLLAALTAYLRATLPLFRRELIELDVELQAAERYLDVMRLRLGARLHTHIDIDAAVRTQRVPPALLLTLVENAIEHGVMPALRAVTVEIHAKLEPPAARAQAARWVLEVIDDGAGYQHTAADAAQPGDSDRGLGLSSVRERLRQAFGPDASLSVSGEPGSGCRARLSWPVAHHPPSAAQASPDPAAP